MEDREFRYKELRPRKNSAGARKRVALDDACCAGKTALQAGFQYPALLFAHFPEWHCQSRSSLLEI
jgi:hypothetical protein